MNPLIELGHFGQAFWLDYIRRNFLTTGELKRMVEEDGLRGITSNPSIFEKAIAGSTDYSSQIVELKCEGKTDPKSVFEALATRDIRDAAGTLRPVYDAQKKRDGYVSLEVSPTLAHDTKGTIAEARRLWGIVDRPNVMIKVPGTPEGVPAIETLISEGINVNVTLLFSVDAYEKAANAYINGLEKFVAKSGDPSGIASVASFFVSRIDTAVDALLEEKEKQGVLDAAKVEALSGKTAIANAKRAYKLYQKLFQGARWEKLAKAGAQTQRLLWASTSTKNPKYRDVLYVEELIGPDTVDTIPTATAAAFRDHGKLRNSIAEDPAGAEKLLGEIETAGVSLKQVTDKLLEEGVKQFADAFGKLLAAIEKALAKTFQSNQELLLPPVLEAAVNQGLDQWEAAGASRKLWEKDASLWTGGDENKWLGWLEITEAQLADSGHLTKVAEYAKSGGFTHAVVLGMGGSSLAPEVLALTFGKQAGYPELFILDSTDPAQVATVEKRLDLAKTLFIVSSKSGTTLEPNIFKQYFFERVKQTVGAEKAGRQFIAVTDPGSKLEAEAKHDNFHAICHGVPSIGGRYSALSDFGMVPAAAMGIDAGKFLDNAEQMVHACASCVPAKENPGVVLGAVLGVLGKDGRNKVTIVASPKIESYGAWLEQLLAESTGKIGKGLIPVDLEPLGDVKSYGNDRLFAYVRYTPAPDAKQDALIEALSKAGQPVVRIALDDIYNLGQEFFRWEIATAVAGHYLGINAFNQPDVEASKIATRNLTSEFEKTGNLPVEAPIFESDGIKLYADARNAADLKKLVDGDTTLTGYLRAHFSRIHDGDYAAVLAYIERNPAHEKPLEQIREILRDKTKAATVLGFGPRFLHSTGQAYKGGPNSGVFLQITCDDPKDLPVPGQKYTFGVVKAAQALGDLQVLVDRKRRALRAHISGNLESGLRKIEQAIA